MVMEQEDVLAIVLITLSAYVLLPFSNALIIGFLSAYGIRFLVDLIGEFIGDRPAEVLVLALFVGVVAGGVFFIVSNGSAIISQVVFLSSDLTTRLTAAAGFVGLPQLAPYIATATSYLGGAAESAITSAISSLPGVLLGVIIYLLSVVVVYRHTDIIEQEFYAVLDRLPAEEGDSIVTIVRSIKETLGNIFIVYGTFSVVQGLLAAVAYYIIGYFTLGHPIPFFWAWGLWIGVAAFLQGLGSTMLTGPLMAYYFINGAFWTGFWLAVYEVTMLFIVPSIALPYLGARRLNESFFVLLLGFIAGPLVFGIKGLILGPVLLITFRNLLSSALFE